MPWLSVTFSCLCYLWSFIPFISKWEGKMRKTSGNRWRHTKQDYGSSKLKRLLLVFLGNQKATGAKNVIDIFSLDYTSISAVRLPSTPYCFFFPPSFFLLFLKQSLHWNQGWSLQRLHSKWTIKDRVSKCCWSGLDFSVAFVPDLRCGHAPSQPCMLASLAHWELGHGRCVVRLVPAAEQAALLYC